MPTLVVYQANIIHFVMDKGILSGFHDLGRTPSDLAELATGRPCSLFTADMRACDAKLSKGVGNRRVLVIGGAGLVAGQDGIVVPKLDPSAGTRSLEDVAGAVLNKIGLRPKVYADADEARLAVPRDLAQGMYPLLLTSLDTSGENPFAEFIGIVEMASDIEFLELQAVQYLPAKPRALADFMGWLGLQMAGKEQVSKAAVVERISRVIPEF